MRTQIIGLALLVRPKHWVKNAFVFAPLLFSGGFLDTDLVSRALIAFILFCIASSATYIFNDILDVERDRRHPVKSKSRPLAAGIVSKRSAFVLLCFLYLALVPGGFFSPQVTVVILAYLLLNFAYTLLLKDLPVIDIFCIASGFVLRVFSGGLAIGIDVSSWMFTTTFCLSLYLAVIKRRQELLHGGPESRSVLKRYTIRLLERYAEMCGTAALIFYCMFAVTSSQKLMITIPVVLFGMFRYWWVVETLNLGESPTDAIFADRQLLLTVLFWLLLCGWALWGAPT